MPAKTFKDAVVATADVSTCFRKGLEALGPDKIKISAPNARDFEGSINIDGCTTSKYPNANRWDYAFAYKGEVFFVEVHSANSREVRAVIKKLQWLQDWLNQDAPEINKLKAKNKPVYYWIQSKGFAIPKTTSQYRAAQTHGIKPIAKLLLK